MRSSTKAWAVIVAAGRGDRFGAGEPKQFVAVAGRPLVLWTVDAFRKHPDILGVSLVVPADVAKQPPAWLASLAAEGVSVVAGGVERTDSVRLGLTSVPAAADVVAVHDGARPLVTRQTISRVLAAVEAGRGAIAARRASDSLKQVDGEGRVIRSLNREDVWRAETPQAFPRQLIQDIHRRAELDGVTASDCAGLCERYEVEVVVVESQQLNPKVTRPEDLEWVELWIRRTLTPSPPPSQRD